MKSGICMALALVAGATHAVAQQGELLARELVFQEKGEGRRSVWTADPLLAGQPEIVRALRAEGVPAVRLTEEDCSEPLPCYHEIHARHAYTGTRLTSIFVEDESFTGGAHGAFAVSDWIYDRARHRRIRFADLFTSWQRAKPVLQARICSALREAREDMTDLTCPPIDELAMSFSESPEFPVGGPAHGFEARTSDYQLGYYAAGRETLRVQIDAAILALIKPDYRGDFAAVAAVD